MCALEQCDESKIERVWITVPNDQITKESIKKFGQHMPSNPTHQISSSMYGTGDILKDKQFHRLLNKLFHVLRGEARKKFNFCMKIVIEIRVLGILLEDIECNETRNEFRVWMDFTLNTYTHPESNVRYKTFTYNLTIFKSWMLVWRCENDTDGLKLRLWVSYSAVKACG